MTCKVNNRAAQISWWVLKLILAGLPTGAAFFVQNQAGPVAPQLLWATDSAITNTIGATEYAGEEFLSYFTTPFTLATQLYNLQRETGLLVATQRSVIAIGKALPALLVRTIITACAVGVSSMNYVGLYDALGETHREYNIAWLIINVLQSLVYVAMISADANQLAKHYLFTAAEERANLNLINKLSTGINNALFTQQASQLTDYNKALLQINLSAINNRADYLLAMMKLNYQTSKLDYVCSALSFMTAIGMLWSFNSMIMLIADRPQLGLGVLGDIMGNWWLALPMNIITNGVFSYLNARSGYRLMLWDYPLKMRNEFTAASGIYAKLLSSIKNFILAGLLYGWVIGSIWTSVYYAVTGANNIERPESISFNNFYQATLTPYMVILMTSLAAVEAFGMNAKPILERAWKAGSAMTQYLASLPTQQSETTPLLSNRRSINHSPRSSSTVLSSNSTRFEIERAPVTTPLLPKNPQSTLFLHKELLEAAKQGDAEFTKALNAHKAPISNAV